MFSSSDFITKKCTFGFFNGSSICCSYSLTKNEDIISRLLLTRFLNPGTFTTPVVSLARWFGCGRFLFYHCYFLPPPPHLEGESVHTSSAFTKIFWWGKVFHVASVNSICKKKLGIGGARLCFWDRSCMRSNLFKKKNWFWNKISFGSVEPKLKWRPLKQVQKGNLT